MGEGDGLRALGEELAEAGRRIDPVLAELLPRRGVPFLCGAIWHHLETGGKRLRPAICLLTCERLGGRSEDALPFAAAVEILHNMLLVHDDLEDGDTVRRDRETVWARYGVANAVNVGDYMLGVAYRAILRTPGEAQTVTRLTDAFTDAFATTCRGQALDINWRGKPDLTVAEYMELVTLKTGRYLALGMVGGALIAGADEATVALLRELAGEMGPAFQIRDDLIDLTAGKGRGGTTGNDVREGKPSILYAHALAAADPEQRHELARIMSTPREETAEEDVARARELYRELGAPERARADADRLVEQALETVERLPVRDKGFFGDLCRYMVERTK